MYMCFLYQWLNGKESTCSSGATGDTGLIPGSGRSPGGGHGNATYIYIYIYTYICIYIYTHIHTYADSLWSTLTIYLWRKAQIIILSIMMRSIILRHEQHRISILIVLQALNTFEENLRSNQIDQRDFRRENDNARRRKFFQIRINPHSNDRM